MSVYIAAPFFNDKQLAIVEEIKAILENEGIEYFSPKDESMFKQGDDPVDILISNCKAIIDSDYVIAVTDDKDVGTIWEAGYAFGNGIPIIYLWIGYEEHMKFNIMLAASGSVAKSYLELNDQIVHFKTESHFYSDKDEDMLHE